MTNNLALSLLALVLTILTALFPLRREGTPALDIKGTRTGSVLAAAFVLLFFGATLVWPATFKFGTPITLALAIGALMGAFSAATDLSRAAFAFGLAVLGASLLHFMDPAAIGLAQVALVAGAFVSAFATGGIRGSSQGGYLCAVSALLVVSVDFLGRLSATGSESAASAGVALGLCFLIASIVAGIVSKSAKSEIVRGGVGFVVLAAIGLLACWKFLNSTENALLWLGGAVVGGVVHLILAGEEEPDSFRFILATVIWLAAATVAFAMNLGFGMAIALLGGAGTLILFGNIRGLMTMSVAAAILLYRLFRELYPAEARALDIGQHYTMMGVAIGALLPLLPIEWGRGRNLSGSRSGIAVALWLVILAGLPVASAILLGSKGAIGMVVGLSFAAVIEGLRGSASLAPMGISLGLGSITILSYSWLGEWTDLERGVKTRAVFVVFVVLLVFAAALFGVSRTQASEPAKQ